MEPRKWFRSAYKNEGCGTWIVRFITKRRNQRMSTFTEVKSTYLPSNIVFALSRTIPFTFTSLDVAPSITKQQPVRIELEQLIDKVGGGGSTVCCVQITLKNSYSEDTNNIFILLNK